MHLDRISYPTRVLAFLALLTAITISAATAQAQSFDHESYPKLDFDLVSLELDLGVQPQNLRIDGDAKYQVEANISGTDTLTLYASHLDISNVSVDGETADFSLHNDSLFIPVDDSTEAGNGYEVRIRYSGQPGFGMLKNSAGTIWTSMLPKSQRHWVPIIDNPQVALQTKFNISVPSGNQVWATGVQTDDEVLSVDAMRYRYESEQEVPASSLGFSVGSFSESDTSFGDKKITLAVEKALSDSINNKEILDQANNFLGEVENYLDVEYPLGALNIIVLDDHSWETKNWGSGMVFVYANGGSIQTQLMRGILGQWFGIKQREQQWIEGDAITLYQTLLLNKIAERDYQLEATDMVDQEYPQTVYDHFGIERWNNWQQGISDWQNASIRGSMLESANRVISEFPAAVRWDDYADHWYQHTGQPIFEAPTFSFDDTESQSSEGDSIAYEVYYDFDETEGELRLRFEATEGSIDELTTLPAYEIYSNKTDTSEVTFTGAQDSVVLQVDPTINTLRLDYGDYPDLTLDEYKPSEFLINELRNTEDVDEQAKAARKLGYHSDNADLQLAIKDFMKRDLDPRVQAALLRSLGDITDGATGTEQTFLDALGNDNQHIREAGLLSLQNYSDNSSIASRVESEAQNAEESDYFKKATRVLTAISSEDAFGGFVESVVQADTTGEKSIIAIRELANMGGVDKAVEQADLFVDDEFSFAIRRAALNILVQHDRAPADWLDRAKKYFEDPDPRIRFLVARGLERNMDGEVEEFLSDYIQDEYDARVHRKIMDIL